MKYRIFLATALIAAVMLGLIIQPHQIFTLENGSRQPRVELGFIDYRKANQKADVILPKGCFSWSITNNLTGTEWRDGDAFSGIANISIENKSKECMSVALYPAVSGIGFDRNSDMYRIYEVSPGETQNLYSGDPSFFIKCLGIELLTNRNFDVNCTIKYSGSIKGMKGPVTLVAKGKISSAF